MDLAGTEQAGACGWALNEGFKSGTIFPAKGIGGYTEFSGSPGLYTFRTLKPTHKHANLTAIPRGIISRRPPTPWLPVTISAD